MFTVVLCFWNNIAVKGEEFKWVESFLFSNVTSV